MSTNRWLVGLFIIGGIVIFGATLFLIGDRHKAFGRHIQLYTDFTNVGGLVKGAKIRVSGYDAGQLKDITIPKEPSGKFRLELEVQRTLEGVVRSDSVVSIATEGVVGDKFIAIAKGTAAGQPLQSGATLRSKEPFDMGALLDQGQGMLKDVHGTITDLHGRLDLALDSVNKTVNHTDDLITGMRGDVRQIAANGRDLTSNLNVIATDMRNGKGTAGMIFEDPKTEAQIRASLNDIQASSASIKQATTHANDMLTDFQSRNLGAKTDATLTNVRAMSQNLNTTLDDALGPDRNGDNGAANLRNTLTNVNRSAANLADDTEALKHNFFLRGFFKKRGYYSLDGIDPEIYRTDRTLAKQMGERKWLSGSGSFARSGNGAEELTASGRSAINEAVASLIDTLPSHPLMVEGYAAGGTSDQNYVQAKRRAELVRQYLTAHFHLDHKQVGIVPLKSPPEGVKVSNWDGAAIVVLQAGK